MSSFKRFIHDPVALVDGACRGVLALHPGLCYDETNRVVFKPMPKEESRVVVLSGGGSGHEPAHVGYIGQGMLDVAVCGAIFASPNIPQIERGLRSVQSTEGTLIIVKNYTGDKLNFGLAAEKYRAATGNKARVVMVCDDVSIGRSHGRMVGRRGLAGTVIAHKVAGAAAADGLSLNEVASVTEFVIKNLASIGVGLKGCDVPGQQEHTTIDADEVELGLGIHNEPGSKKIRPQPSTPVLVAQMLENLLDPTDSERNYLDFSMGEQDSDFVLLVNNLGGLSVIELTAVTSIIAEQLNETYGIKPCRAYAGTYLSALNGPGFSITLLRLPGTHAAQKDLKTLVLSYLDAPTSAIGWTSSISAQTWQSKTSSVINASEPISTALDVPRLPCDAKLLSSVLVSIRSSLIEAEPQITAFDTLMGDGDCGTTLVAGASTVASAVYEMRTDSLTHATIAIAELISKGMGGTSGALYAIFFTAFANSARGFNAKNGATFPMISQMASEALETLQRYTAANIGDRTMMDALIPFITTLDQNAKNGVDALTSLERSVKAASTGAQATRNMKSMFGRSTYVGVEGDSEDETKGLPDPGALGVVAIGAGIIAALQSVSFEAPCQKIEDNVTSSGPTVSSAV